MQCFLPGAIIEAQVIGGHKKKGAKIDSGFSASNMESYTAEFSELFSVLRLQFLFP
jgi:hypothetical protein